MAQGTAQSAIRFVVVDLIGDIVAFPLWWYTRGFARTISWVTTQARYQWQVFGVGVWVKNLFVPMFGQRDISGRLISFFLRLAQIIARAIGYFLFLILLFSLLIFWILFPPAVVTLLIFQFSALVTGV